MHYLLRGTIYVKSYPYSIYNYLNTVSTQSLHSDITSAYFKFKYRKLRFSFCGKRKTQYGLKSEYLPERSVSLLRSPPKPKPISPSFLPNFTYILYTFFVFITNLTLQSYIRYENILTIHKKNLVIFNKSTSYSQTKSRKPPFLLRERSRRILV